MMLKVKALAAMAAAMSLECVAPMQPAVPPAEETAISRQTLAIAPLPPRPANAPTRGWERGISTGLPASGAQSVYVVMYKDPSLTGRFLAFGYDVAGQRSLFVFSVMLSDENNFKNQLTIDSGAWRTSRGTLPSEEGTTDGIGGTTPPPRPQLDDMMWMHAFYHHSIKTQIDAGGPPAGGP
jgi:hypothetical protein